MEIVYEGKTKRIMSDGKKVLLQFKDTVTGDAHGKLDTGGDFVVGSIKGKGVASAKVAAYFFKLLKEFGIPTHFRRTHSDSEIEVSLAEKIPLEVIYRAKAFGSFLARYKGRVEPMAQLDLVEFNLKDDALKDPLITPQAIVKLGLASEDELERMEEMVRKIASVVSKALADKGLELVDMKIEFGRADGELLMVDELSGDTMRVCDKIKKRMIDQMELARRLGLT
jgi:phosphoribosylaminoimidazole-succinocarboxamide synthase